MKIEVHQIAKVAEGYEYLYTLLDDDDNVILGNQSCFIGQKKPKDEKEIAIWKQARLEYYAQIFKEDVDVDPELKEKEKEYAKAIIDKALQEKEIDTETYQRLKNLVDTDGVEVVK